jgi:hypothetical protein
MQPIATCFCGELYDPADSSTLMHFCPRPSCRKAYHATCLAASSSASSSVDARAIQLLSSSSDSDKPFRMYSKSSRPSSRTPALTPLTEEALSTLPQALVTLAQQPIVKGAQFRQGGISGNVRAVLLARKTVYDTLNGTPLAENWDKNYNPTRIIAFKRKPLPFLSCPNCAGPI